MSLLFKMQVGVSLTGLALGVGMLACGKDPAVYLPVVTSILGLWLPTPTQPVVPAAPQSSSSVGSPEAVGDWEHTDSAHRDTQTTYRRAWISPPASSVSPSQASPPASPSQVSSSASPLSPLITTLF
jgi:hypothetical protein